METIIINGKEHYTVDFSRQVISSYIYDKKGEVIKVGIPRTEKDYQLFEIMCTYAFKYYGI